MPGIKLGDFGFGHSSYTHKAGDPCELFKACIGLTLLASFLLFATFGPFVYLANVERDYHLDIGVLDEAFENARDTTSARVNASLDNELVFVTAPHPTLVVDPPEDPLFHVRAKPEYPKLQRLTEYCQWQETSTSSTTEIGKDDNGNAIYRTDYYYTYHKTWRSYQVNSLLFHTWTSYHNPTRDPAPSHNFYPLDSRGSNIALDKVEGQASLFMDSRDVDDALEMPIDVALDSEMVKTLGEDAKAQGFSEVRA